MNFKFKNEGLKILLKDLESIDFSIDRYAKVKCEGVRRQIEINEGKYNFGIGGLHSTESRRSIVAADDEMFIDVDVSSCYPKIILNNELSPPQLGNGFLKIYETIYNGRIEAKLANDKAKSEVLKIVLNGSFGKFADGHRAEVMAGGLFWGKRTV